MKRAALASVMAVLLTLAGALPTLADDFTPVSLGGFVYEDYNGNGTFDLGEVPLEGWPIDLLVGDQITMQTYTDGAGNYTFFGVGEGTFYVAQDPFGFWFPSPESYAVTTSSGIDVGRLDFGSFQGGYIQGEVFADQTGDGFSPDDKLLYVPVVIDLYLNGNPVPIASTTSDSGRYIFNPVGMGVYTVHERVPTGYTLTAEVGATIYGHSGLRSDSNDFDNLSPSTVAITMSPFQAVEGATFAGSVAMLTSTNPAAVASDFTATVQWGDGYSSAGSITSNPSGGFLVSAMHVYAEAGTYTVVVTAGESGGSPAIGSESVTVADAALHASGLALPASSTPFSGVVATFTDDNPSGLVGDYSAGIDWGDGTSSAGAVSAAPSGVFAVAGSHSYAEGRYMITTTITDEGGASASATSTIAVDLTPPATTATITGNVLTFAASDNLTAVSATYYSINGSAAQLYSEPVRLKNGKSTIRYWSVDGAGNTETTHSMQVTVKGK
jgi:hypothetical protein